LFPYRQAPGYCLPATGGKKITKINDKADPVPMTLTSITGDNTCNFIASYDNAPLKYVVCGGQSLGVDVRPALQASP
jgi:hypothetical protein